MTDPWRDGRYGMVLFYLDKFQTAYLLAAPGSDEEARALRQWECMKLQLNLVEAEYRKAGSSHVEA